MSSLHPLAQAALNKPERPDPRHTLISVCVGDEELTAECHISGQFRPAVTQADPEFCHPAESPEVEVVRLWLASPWRDVSGLMENTYISEDIQDQCDAYVADMPTGPDPDDAYDRWRDAQMEARS